MEYSVEAFDKEHQEEAQWRKNARLQDEIDLPSFSGKLDLEAFLNWIKNVESFV